MDAPKPVNTPSPLYQRLLDKGLNKTLAAEWDLQIQGLLPSNETHLPKDIVQALSQAIKAKRLVGTNHHFQPTHQKRIIVMGPSGAGKTSVVAKMAAKRSMNHPDSVAVLSLDNQRVAGSAELERFAPIIGVQFKKACKADEITSALTQWKNISHIIVDTPAISLEDPLQREKLRRQLELIGNSEHLMVTHGATQEKTIARMVQYFKPLTIHSLCFTGLDWCVDVGALLNQSDKQQLPIGFISDTPKIGEALKTATADLLSGMLIGEYTNGVSADHDPVTVVTQSKLQPERYYVANRNSDIFHFHECKSVKRINTDNMIVFKDSAEALGQKFKPCRMCCSELIVSQPYNRLARGYAGSRY